MDVNSKHQTGFEKPDVDKYRRLLDVALAAVCLPPAAAIAGATVLSLFANGQKKVIERTPTVGRNGESFDRFRFVKVAHPKRLVRLSRLLDSLKAREYPALFSILKGEMSFVGPREMGVEEAADLGEEDRARFVVRPGLTDPFSIKKRMNIAYEPRGIVEKSYLSQRSAIGDLVILCKSIPTILMNPSGLVKSDSFNLLDIQMSNITMREAVLEIARLSKDGKKQIAFVNPHCVNISVKDSEYKGVLGKSDLVLPDGVGLQLASLIVGTELKENVNGTDLFPFLCEKAAQDGLKLVLLGGQPGVADQVKSNMEEQFPGLIINGVFHGHFEENSEEEAEIVAAINKAKPDLLFVAMGVPRQDVWIAHNIERLNVGAALGVGGLFDFYSGRIPRAPLWMREVGMEWIWRFSQEPKRMFSRYILGNPLFLFRVWSWFTEQSQWSLTERFQRLSDPGGYQATQFRLTLRKLLWRAGLDGTLLIKRGTDVLGAGAGLLILSPLFAVTAAAIAVEDRGPVFFTQKRVGRRGQEFDFYKFRSMGTDASKLKEDLLEQNESDAGVIFKMKRDPRITRVGSIIRRFSIDELPQMYNVLKGDMSLVGPRPPLPSEVAQYKVGDRYRLEVIPGLTCLWQTSGRSDLDFNTQVELDTNYIMEQSFLNDLILIVKTIPAVLNGQGAY